jgi:CRP-like cAMP-binding protein
MSAKPPIKIPKGQWLFREGETSNCMYLIKSGRVAIVKVNHNNNEEIILSERVNGQLIGEMSFFDGKPRSAGVKAMTLAEVIELPFSTLHDQFEKVPPWLKVMVKTINNQLREANIRIRNLENIAADSKDKLLPHTLLRICTMISLVGSKTELSADDNPVVPYKDLNYYCSQIFHQPAHKLNKTLKGLQKLNLLEIDEEDENQNVVLLEHQVIDDFSRWYHGYLSTESTKQVVIEENELPTFQAVVYYGQEAEADDDGNVTVDLNEVQKNAKDDLDLKFSMIAFDNLAKKGLFSEKIIEDGAAITKFNFEEMAQLSTYWSIIHTVQGAIEA